MTETEVMVKEIVGTKKIERKTSSDGLDSKLDALEKATKALQTAAESENLAEFAKANEDAKDAQDDYNNYFTKYCFENFLEAEHPAFEVLKAGFLDYKSIKGESTMGSVTYSVVTVSKQINFLAFNAEARCFGNKLGKAATLLAYYVSLYKTAQVANGKNIISGFNHAYQTTRRTVAQDQLLSKAPSKTLLKKALQDVIDELWFVDNGKNENKYVVTTQWCNFMLDFIVTARMTKTEAFYQTTSPEKVVQACANLMHKLINRYDISIKVEDKTVPAVELTAQDANEAETDKK